MKQLQRHFRLHKEGRFKQMWSCLCTAAFILLSASCSSEKVEDAIMPDTEEKNTGNLALSLHDKSATRATTTVISGDEADNFLITVYKGLDIIRETTKLKDLNKKLSAGYGYTVKAENCTELTAEDANENWGMRRFSGLSEPFAIIAGETTKVGVYCTVANAGIEVVFDESVPQYFTDSYSVTINEAGRTIIFDETTGGSSVKGNITEGKIAYFNVDEDGSRNITYKIEAYGQGMRLVKSNTLTLGQAKIIRLKLTFVPGTFDLQIIADTKDIYMDQTIDITEKDVIQDDGSTDMDGNHESFDNAEDNVDISDYEQK